MRAYLFVETESGRTQRVAASLYAIHVPAVRLVSVDTVTGPWDIIAVLEGAETGNVRATIMEGVRRMDGVETALMLSAVQQAGGES